MTRPRSGTTPAPAAWVAIADELRRLIKSGSLAQGLELRESCGEERWGKSRVPVREAYHVLGAGGWLTLVPGAPTRVRRFVRSDAMEMSVVLVAVLAAAGHKLCERDLGHEQRQRFITAGAKLEECCRTIGEPAPLRTEFRSFFESILSMAATPYFTQTAELPLHVLCTGLQPDQNLAMRIRSFVSALAGRMRGEIRDATERVVDLAVASWRADDAR